MFETICTLPLSSDIFCQAIHPSEPLVAVGLAAGHVQTFRLPPVASDDDSDNDASLASNTGFGHVDTLWRTKRHKGSCRTLDYSVDGTKLYSAGTDGIVKIADTETGRVTAKIRTPVDRHTNEPHLPSLLHLLSPQTFLLATDSGALHVYDIRKDGSLSNKSAQAHHPHEDFVSSLTPLPPSEASTSGHSKQWVTTGGTTLAVTDIRRGVLVKSEDQEEELLSSVYVDGLSKRGSSQGQKVIVGGAGGVLTLWERGVWDDQDERIHVDRGAGGGESLDVLTLLPDGVGATRKTIAVGLGSGQIRFVQIGANSVVGELQHEENEGVAAIGFDAGGRMISAGGSTLKVWREKFESAAEQDDDLDDDVNPAPKRNLSDSSEDDSDSDSSEEEAKDKKKRKKTKRNKGKTTGLKNGILGFKGMD